LNETIFHLEPDIKETPGGLRDLHVLSWLKTLAGDAGEDAPWIQPVDGARDFLFAVRCFLHFRSGRDNNRLGFEAQEEYAALDFVRASCQTEQRGDPARWMREYFRNVRAIRRETLRALEAHEGAGSSLLAGFRDWRSRLSNSEFTVSRDRVLMRSPHALEKDPDLALRMFQFVGRHGIPLHLESQRRLQQYRRVLDQHLSSGRPLWTSVREIFASKHCSTALRAMHENGLLGALFPEFEGIECAVIRDFNHRYTVDEHTLITLQNLEESASVEDPSHKRFAGLLEEIPDLVALRVALLFHDCGKSGEGEESHTQTSARLAAGALSRIHAPGEMIEIVCFLIEHHLDLSAVMTGRDLEDPATAFLIAHGAATIEKLKALTLLTYADVGAVRPGAMSAWRAEQLWRVYRVGHRELTRELDTERIELPASGSAEQEAFLKGFPTRYLRTHTEEQILAHLGLEDSRRKDGVAIDIRRRNGVYELDLLTKDRLFLFASVAGTLASFGLNILKAEAFANQQGTVLDTFVFADPQRTLELNPPEMDRLRATLERVLLGKIRVAELLRNRQTPPPPSKGSRIEPTVAFDGDASAASTLVEVTAEDRPGLLYDLANTFSDKGCSIDVVLVDTEAHKAIDVFYVTTNGKKLDKEKQAQLQESLLSACRA
jgi:[protein-PII] uridylyltransferase